MKKLHKGNKLLHSILPVDENTPSTFQRYIWTMPLEEVKSKFTESILNEYKIINK